MFSEILVSYDVVLYYLFSNSLRKDRIDMSHDHLNVSKASNAWYFVAVESFLYDLFRWLIITSTPFSLAMLFSGISKTASCASPSRDNIKAEHWLYSSFITCCHWSYLLLTILLLPYYYPLVDFFLLQYHR